MPLESPFEMLPRLRGPAIVRHQLAEGEIGERMEGVGAHAGPQVSSPFQDAASAHLQRAQLGSGLGAVGLTFQGRLVVALGVAQATRLPLNGTEVDEGGGVGKIALSRLGKVLLGLLHLTSPEKND